MQNSLGKKILELVGGEENVKSVSRCATRLRFTLKNEAIAQERNIENLDGVISIVKTGGQFQVVIGPKVESVYQDLIFGSSFDKDSSNESCTKNKNILSLFMETVSSLFTPLLPLLAGSGLLRGCVLLCTQIGLLSEKSSTYHILTAASMAVFYLLPILLAYTSAKKFKCSEFVSVAIMGALISPEFTDLMGNVGNGAITEFLSLPIVLMNYTYTVIPAILSIYVYSYLEIKLKKFIPETIQLCFVPLFGLLIMVPLTAGVIGPLGVYLGNGISYIVNTLINFNGWIAGALVGGFWNILVIFGIHWAVNPVMIQNISTIGYDYIVPFTAATNFGMAGATFGTFLRLKNQKMKQFSMSALLSIFFAGITEPAIYGVGLKYKKPIIAAFIGGALGGAFMGGMGVKSYAFVFGGLTTIPAFAGPTLIYYVIGLLICFIVSAGIMFALGVDENEIDNKEKKANANNKSEFISEDIYSPINGEVKDLSQCKDEMFSKGMMGAGALIIPKEGRVYAPFDGTVISVFNTLHALGLRSNNGVELLIHIGLDTVELKGEPFKLLKKVGDVYKKGDLLLNFDIDKIKNSGKSIETPIIITNTNGKNVLLEKIGVCSNDEIIIHVEKGE